MAQRVRAWAAAALVRSPNPHAWPLLLALWNDSDRGVRQAVLHAAGQRPSAETTAVLEEMRDDPDQYIRTQAREHLAQRGKKK